MKPAEEKARKEIAKTVLRRLSDGTPRTRTELFNGLKPTSASWQLIFLRRLGVAGAVRMSGETSTSRRYACADLDRIKGLVGNETALAHLLWPAAGPNQEEESWVTEEILKDEQVEGDDPAVGDDPADVEETPPTEPPALTADDQVQVQVQNLKLLMSAIQNIISLRERLDAIEKNQTEVLSILRRLL